MIEKEIQKLIENYIEDIENYNLEKVYGMCPIRSASWLGQLTETLLKIGVNPLEHMKYVPSNYMSNSGILSVTIPENVESLLDNAFSNSSIDGLTIPSTVVDIGMHVASYCPRFKKLDLSNYEGNVPIGICEGCGSLTDVKLPKNCTSIEANAFRMCRNLEELQIDNTKDYVMSNIKFAKGWTDYTEPKHIKCSDGYVTVYGDGLKLEGN